MTYEQAVYSIFFKVQDLELNLPEPKIVKHRKRFKKKESKEEIQKKCKMYNSTIVAMN